MRILLAIILAFMLGIGTVSADELWVRNEGGLEISVWSDTEWTEVEVAASCYAVGPSWTPEPGKAKVCAVCIPGPEWVVITADNIARWDVEVACNQRLEDIEPVVFLEQDRTTPPHWTFYVWDTMLRAFRPR